jgi:hypothetical protein
VRHTPAVAPAQPLLFRRSPGGTVPTGSRRVGLWLVLAWLAVCGWGPSARAQVPDDEDELEAQLPAQRNFIIDESNFDMWVFGNSRNGATALARLETVLHLKIAELDRAVRLTKLQKQKLELASRGDIKRFFDKVEEKRKAFQLVRNDQQKFGEFYQQLQPLQQTFNQGLFGDDSLFAKTVKKTLDRGQVAQYDDLSRQRRVLRQQAKLGRVLATLDNSLGLDTSQRRRLSKLIVEETHPPRKPSSYDFYVVLYQLALLPEERIRPILHEAQWKVMSPMLIRAKAYKLMLSKQGLLPGEPGDERWVVSADPEAPKSTPNEKKSD